MKQKEEKLDHLFTSIHRGLKVFLVLLGGIFVVGTIYGVFLRVNPKNHSGLTASSKVGEGQTFTGIGRIRISTIDESPSMIMLFVTFVYYPADKAFSEELALRVQEFRQITIEYFGSFSISEFQILSEDSLKTELLRRYNAILRLGQIEALYFSDFMLINDVPENFQEP